MTLAVPQTGNDEFPSLPTQGNAPPLPTLLIPCSPNQSLKCPRIRSSLSCSLADPELGVDKRISTRSAAMPIVHRNLRGRCLPLRLARPALGASVRRWLPPPCACGCACPALPCPGAIAVPRWLVPCNCRPALVDHLFPTSAFISA